MTAPPPPAAKRSQSHSGRWTVVAMLSFGALCVSAMAVYWEFYTRPFRGLQAAIVGAYPDSQPQVVGGRHKSHKLELPLTLRIVARVPLQEFHPEAEPERSEQRALELARIAQQHHPLRDYEMLEIRLIQVLPEKELRRWSASRTIEEWERLLSDSPPAAPGGFSSRSEAND